MAYDVTNFSDYVGRESDAITKTLFIGGDTGKFARYMTGIKGSTTVPHISGDATLQAGLCKNPSGGVDVATVTLAVSPWTFYESFCQDDIQTKFPSMILKPGSANADAPKAWEETIVDVKAASIQKTLELTYWQGNTASGSYQLFDGFVKKIDAATGVIDGNTSEATAITQANVIGLVDAMIVAAPVDVKENDEFVVTVGNDVFDLYIAAIKASNLYSYNADNVNGEYMIGGANKKLMRIRGLDGTARMFASAGYNLIVGADLMEESEDPIIKIWYDETDDLLYMRAKGKSGVTISNPAEIVEFTVSS